MITNTLIAYLAELLGVVAVTMLLSISPRLAPLPITFRYPNREMRLVFGMFAIILAIAALMPLIPGLEVGQSFGLLSKPNITAATNNELLHRLLIDMLCLVPVGLALAYCHDCAPFPSVGWNSRDLRPAFQLGIGLGLVAMFLTGKFFALVRNFSFESVFLLIIWLGIGLIEETIFRGYIQSRLSAYWNRRTGWVVTAVLYTLWLLPGLLTLPDFPVQTVIVLVRGLVLGWIMQKTGHVLAPGLYRAISGWIQFL